VKCRKTIKVKPRTRSRIGNTGAHGKLFGV
jgi:hypothetical protein